MSLAHIPIDKITETELASLLTGRSAETRTVEFKRATYGSADKDYGEFLADISSLANTAGGDLIIGIDAPQGIATSIVPFSGDPDAEKLRLESIARTALQPRLPRLDAHAVPIGAGGHVLIFRTPRSYNAPHRVTRQNSNRFWARTSAGKYEPDVGQLRALFLAGPQMADRVTTFVNHRLSSTDARIPVPLQSSNRLFVHIVPFASLEGGVAVDLKRAKDEALRFAPFGTSHAERSLINVDGLLALSNPTERGYRAYVQLFRSGILEAVASNLVSNGAGPPGDDTRRVRIDHWSEELVDSISKYVRLLADYQVDSPAAIAVSMTDVQGVPFVWQTSSWSPDYGLPIDRNPLTFSHVAIADWPADKAAVAEILRPILDEIANAGGKVRSPLFDSDGNYVPKS